MAQKILGKKESKISQLIKGGKVKETKVTIPAEFINKLDIDVSKHRIIWTLIQFDEGLFLGGALKNVKEDN